MPRTRLTDAEAPEADTEGHMPRRMGAAEASEDDNDVEGHRVEPPRDQA